MSKIISRWKIVANNDNTASLVGEVNGWPVTTAPIKEAKRGEVKTHQTHYVLAGKSNCGWERELATQRPSLYQTLVTRGVL